MPSTWFVCATKISPIRRHQFEPQIKTVASVPALYCDLASSLRARSGLKVIASGRGRSARGCSAGGSSPGLTTPSPNTTAWTRTFRSTAIDNARRKWTSSKGGFRLFSAMYLVFRPVVV